MGIKGLWGILTPYSEKKSLHEIRGETIAVDLSGWVCDSQNVTDYYVQPKLYLRNLFFRTVYLLLADIKPIFVLEGDAPELKRDVMALRNAIQFRGAAPRTENATRKPDVARKRFKGVQKECETLLRCMGVSCIKGDGEAEATCAQLNSQGLVDAVVSQDSDCFAYGARTVYRNFSVSNAAGGGAMQGSVDCYDAAKMFQENGFGRNKMVALALLCGCDYNVGACGSSIVTVVSFLHTVTEDDVIPRLVSWVSDTDSYEEQQRWLSVPGRCDRCGHAGRTHGRNGCPVCATHRGCEDTGHKSKLAEVKRELGLRSRALSCGNIFPDPTVMKEFLKPPAESISVENLKPNFPSLIQFVKIMKSKLDWSERYCVEKFLPILTKFHLQGKVPHRTIKPVKINKKRAPRGMDITALQDLLHAIKEAVTGGSSRRKDDDIALPIFDATTSDSGAESWCTNIETLAKEFGWIGFTILAKAGVPSFEIIWENIEGQYEGLIPDEQYEDDEDRAKPWTTTERQDLFREFYPALVAEYEESIKKPVKEKKKVGRKKKEGSEDKTEKPKRKYNKKIKKVIDTEFENLSSSMNNMNISTNANCKFNTSKLNVSIKVNKLKRKLKKPPNQKSIQSFIKSKRRKSKKALESFKYSFKDIMDEADKEFDIVNNKENLMENKHSLSILNISDDEINESDLSNVVDNIVTKCPTSKTVKVNNNLVKLIFKTSTTPRKSGFKRSVLKEMNNCSTPRDSPIKNRIAGTNISNNSINGKVNTSYFFDKLTEECDAFEMSVHYDNDNILNSDSDKTVNYSLCDVYL